ncbi:MAG: cobaltochelatase subunit CobN, partial [Methylocystis sp.]|nr:cobaltochelatase subunit CobN [Methylocystis sp.]
MNFSHFSHTALRCASLAQLKHPYSVDLYIDNVARHAKLIVVRLLGGKDYWAYGVEQLETLARGQNIALAIVPGDAHDDMRVAKASTLDAETLDRIWRYFQDGGTENLRSFLGYAATLAGHAAAWSESVPIENAGRFEPACRTKLSAPGNHEPRATIIFYRSLYLADDTAPIVALADALHERGFAVDALYVASLKEPESEAFVANALDAFAPDVIVNATAFSARRDKGSVLDRADCPVLQVALATSTREAWQASARGANGADLAMNVVLPEVDGRIFTRAISFKEQGPLRLAAEFNETRHAPEEARISFVASLAANWARLRRKPNAEKSLALVLSDYPARRGRSGYAIGLDAEASVGEIVKALCEAGYDVGAPVSPLRVVRTLEDATHTIDIPLPDYRKWLAALPAPFAASVNGAWGDASADPAIAGDAFRLSCIVSGNLVIALQPDRGARTERYESYHDINLPPRHAYLAFYLWLRHVRKTDALIHVGAHGTLEWLPGKSVFLSQNCAVECVLGPTPLIYPFIVNDPGEGTQAKRRTSAVIIDHLTPPLTRAETYGPLK